MKNKCETFIAILILIGGFSGVFWWMLPTTPPPALVGACCREGPDGRNECHIVTEALCSAGRGLYVGDNSACSPSPCE